MARIQRKTTLQQKKKRRAVDAAENKAESLSGKNKPALKNVKNQAKNKVAKPDNFITKTKQFFNEVKIEFKKVAWPSRKQTIQSTIVVIILVIIISMFLGLVDFGLSSLIQWVLN